jgi:hypothetical protein
MEKRSNFKLNKASRGILCALILAAASGVLSAQERCEQQETLQFFPGKDAEQRPILHVCGGIAGGDSRRFEAAYAEFSAQYGKPYSGRDSIIENVIFAEEFRSKVNPKTLFRGVPVGVLRESWKRITTPCAAPKTQNQTAVPEAYKQCMQQRVASAQEFIQWIEQPSAQLSRELVEYVFSMGVNPAFMVRVYEKSIDDVLWLSPQQLKLYLVDNFMGHIDPKTLPMRK